MSYRILVNELAIEVSNEDELRIALKLLNAGPTCAHLVQSGAEAGKRIRKRLQEIRRSKAGGQ